jgi:hypothetical protein
MALGIGKTATLEDIPAKAVELEEYVAALFQASRHFVEKQVIEREPEAEILELDAVATSYETGLPYSTLVEAKSGDWGFADAFKVRGWMEYLKIKHGALFASKKLDKDPKFFADKCAEFDLRFVYLGDFTDSIARFQAAGFPTVHDPFSVQLWRWSYWAERELIRRVKQHAKTNPTQKGPVGALQYLHLVNNGVFFTPDVRQRLRDLYSAYQEHPKLSLGIALEDAGGEYDPTAIDPTNAVIKQAMYEGTHPLVQAAFYAEHRARLVILKAAIDHECAVEAGEIPAPKITKLGEPFDFGDLTYWVLPGSFRAGLDELKTHAAFKRYPLFWQVFLWGFGGMYLSDRKETEFKWLSEETGVPVEEVPNALRAFDILFPVSGGWLVTPGPTYLTRVKMMPYPMAGIGSFLRRQRYAVAKYQELGYEDYTTKDLAIRHNAVVELLGH